MIAFSKQQWFDKYAGMAMRALEGRGRSVSGGSPLAAYTDGQLYDELRRRGWVAATWAREEALLSDKEGDVDDVHEVLPELVDTACPVCDEPRLWCWCDGEKGGGRRE